MLLDMDKVFSSDEILEVTQANSGNESAKS